jgi:hypothetical protein
MMLASSAQLCVELLASNIPFGALFFYTVRDTDVSLVLSEM